MKKIYYIIFSVFVFVGCSDETTFFNEEGSRIDLSLEKSTTVLDNGISSNENGILGVYFEHEISGKNGAITSEAINDFHLNLVGQVSRPSFDQNSNLTATHVDYQDDFAYVSYNTIGESFAGAVDVINLSNPTEPVLVSRMYMNFRDANIIMYDSGYIYVLGSVDTEIVFEATGPSFIAKIGVNNGVIDLDNVNYFYQDGNTATGITKMDNAFYVSSGINGSIAKYDSSTFTKSIEFPFNDLRSVASENGRIAVLNTTTGVTIMDGDLNVLTEIATSTSFVEDAKRTIAMTSNQLIVPEGEQGAGVYNLDTGMLEERLPILIDPDNIASSDRVTNAVAINGDATLLANGGAGLALRVSNDIIDLMGVVELKGSINYVVSNDDYIFAASGTSGLQIINKIRSDESFVVQEGTYAIRSRRSTRLLALASSSTNDGVDIRQQNRNGLGETERWRIEALASGAYVITNDFSNSVAQKADNNFNVEQGQYVGSPSQQWAIEPAAQEGYFYIRNLVNNEYMDVFRNRTAAGTTIITWPFHGNSNQQWTFELIE